MSNRAISAKSVGATTLTLRSFSPPLQLNITRTLKTTPMPTHKFADVGINLTDPTYRGWYYNKKHHSTDIPHVLARATSIGCTKLMITGSDLSQSSEAILLARQYPGQCYATVGVHPCSASQFSTYASGGAEGMLSALSALAKRGKEDGTVTAFGEIGLDYDRLALTDKETQLRHFTTQLALASTLQLPLFLHSRAAHADFVRLLGPCLPQLPTRGLVHSFTGTLSEMQELLDLGLDIGINGCSMKSAENLEVVREVPLERLQIETDGPWCEMRASHASAAYKDGSADIADILKSVKKEKWRPDAMVKGRNESATIYQVACVVAGVKGISMEAVSTAAWNNSIRMFGLGESDGGSINNGKATTATNNNNYNSSTSSEHQTTPSTSPT